MSISELLYKNQWHTQMKEQPPNAFQDKLFDPANIPPQRSQLVLKQKKEGDGRERKTKSVGGEDREKEKRGGQLSAGHFGCHLSPWRRGPGPQKPLGRTDCLRGGRYFLQHHLSLSPHNDSPRSSLLMFVIALSHKGDDQWSREEHRGVRRCRIAVCPCNATSLSLSAASALTRRTGCSEAPEEGKNRSFV